MNNIEIQVNPLRILSDDNMIKAQKLVDPSKMGVEGIEPWKVTVWLKGVVKGGMQMGLPERYREDGTPVGIPCYSRRKCEELVGYLNEQAEKLGLSNFEIVKV